MVQRKLPSKLSLHSLPLHAHAHANNLDLKSPRGADLKAKKMKKSASIKRPKLPPSTPNYMKPTTSSDARKDQSSHSNSNSNSNLISSSPSSSSSSGKKRAARTLTKNPSFKPSRAKCSPVAISICESEGEGESVSVDSKSQKPTCSSTLKHSKFPALLSLNPEGTSAIKVCPYKYCSLNGHHHHPPLPPLQSFLSARRKLIKKQRRPPSDAHSKTCTDITKEEGEEEEEESKIDFFLQIYIAQDQHVLIHENDDLAEVDQDSDIGSDMEWETGYSSPPQFDYDYQYEGGGGGEVDGVEIKVSSDGKDWCFDECLVDEEACQESCDEEGFTSDAFSTSDDGDDDLQSSNTNTVYTSPLIQVLVEDDENNHILSECNTPTTDHYEVSFADLSQECVEAVVQDEFVKAQGGNGVEMEREEIALLKFSANKKKVVVEDDELGAFNPRAPNFLMVEPDPEAEKVDLRHQDLDERKNSEEWMVDYALRQVVTKLGHARKRKVALLVEAFEKVTPTAKFDLHLSHGSAFDRPRQIQACS